MSRISSGIGISGSSLTSCRISSIGKSGARSSGPTGSPVPGCRTGCGALGMSARMLYQRRGSCDSSSRNFVRSMRCEDSGFGAALQARPKLGGNPLELRDDLLAIRLERLFLRVRHQIDVELVDADRLELLQLRGRLLRCAEDAEAVADLVGD